MSKVRCNFCGSEQHEERRIEYLDSHQGDYLLVPNTPVGLVHRGMVYYDAAVLKEIEARFFAIQRKSEEPDRYIEIPAKTFV